LSLLLKKIKNIITIEKKTIDLIWRVKLKIVVVVIVIVVVVIIIIVIVIIFIIIKFFKKIITIEKKL